ncbi:MAG: hypothetical protein KKD44_13600 [Proteobacteria bacterium]|nr:hypothetical protein [Pseudomonadota bacterium]
MPFPATMKKNNTVWFSSSDSPHVVSEDNTSYLFREMKIERRVEERLALDEGAYSVIDSYAPQICSIINIGSNGLSYVYFKGDEPAFESLTMDIIVTGYGFCLERIPFKKVADYKAPDATENSPFEKRVACIEFVDLSEDQQEKINAFIDTHARKTVN